MRVRVSVVASVRIYLGLCNAIGKACFLSQTCQAAQRTTASTLKSSQILRENAEN